MNRAELRAVLARRLRWVWRALAMPGVRLALRWTLRLGLVAYFLFVALILLLRYWVFPGVAGYQAQIEAAASAAIGMPVQIERIQANWDGLNPRLTLNGVRLADRQGKPALRFEQVESILSWHTLWRWKPILSLLAIDGPVLHMRRDSAGRITIAGVDTEGEADPRMADWFFEQRRIRIRNATIVWEDAKRNAPPLALEDLQFGLDNQGKRHRFGLSAVPPAHLASRLDIRGDVQGNLMENFDLLSGQIFAELDYADLAGWRAWVDYPMRLSQGRGALRVWGDWEEGKGSVTADMALEDVRIQMGEKLPQLELSSMRGRVEGSYRRDAWRFAGKKVELSTLAGGIRVPPTDFNVEWKQAKTDELVGSATANLLDLEALERLAAYLPLDARSRALLTTHQPRGRIAEARVSWESKGENLLRYGLNAHFDGMGMRAAGYFPGASGLSGEIVANENGGWLTLDNKASSLDLPTVFPEPHIALAALQARASWKIVGKALEARLDHLEFSGPDAAGSASGSYRFSGDGPGVIDMTAALSRAEGNAIWRYMPHVVNADTRAWLKRGISGAAGDAKMVLKGDLRDFPFADKKNGEFRITAKAKGVKVDYAPGWPVIEGVNADLSFGVGMRIEASKGSIFGARLGPVVVEIPNFETEETLLINGQAEGASADFLRFIEKSPVAANINRLTDDMRATGDGKLSLKLDIPLRHAKDTRVQGDYQFLNNQVTAVAGLPSVAQVNGRLSFTERSVTAPEITGHLFGAPMRLSVRNEGERVLVAMSGGVVARELRKALDTPIFDYLSGQTNWKGEVRVRKKTTEFVIESNLLGLSSSLPEPFNKSATASVSLRLEKSSLATAPADGVMRDQLHLALRGIAEATLQRRHEGETMLVERGVAAVGAPLPALPTQGIALTVNAPRLDGDFWRRLVQQAGDGVNAGGGISKVALKTPLLRLFGRDFNEIDLHAATLGDVWQVELNSREAAGSLVWQAAGKGSLKADLKKLVIPAEAAAGGTSGEALDELIESLPALDIRVADFAIGAKRLGKLEAKAHNERGAWHLENLALHNPDGSLEGKGEWRSRAGRHHTRLDFKLGANDIGHLLERLGYPGAVRSGTANLVGDLSWDGPLTAIHYPSLTGELKVRAEKGQFTKLDPGIGKLLGLLSLQSLPRRLTLDFRDIFSDGFAFDSIQSRLTIKTGVMRTADELRIDGPSARILMKGEADLKAETQDVLVTVQPEVGPVAGVAAAALAHPVIGAVAVVVNSIFKKPLNRIFAFQYHVTGTWADPKVEKVGQSPDTPVDGAPPKSAVEKK